MIYLVATNPEQVNFDRDKVHETITKSSAVVDWWHYLPNTYLIQTKSNSDYLSVLLTAKFPGLLFFITKVDLNDVNGVLNKRAWDWINRKTKLTLQLKPARKLFPLKVQGAPQSDVVRGLASINSALDDLLKNKK